MDPATKAKLFAEGGKFASDLLRAAMSRPRKSPTEKAEIEEEQAPSSGVSLATSEETTIELKRRLAKELYRAELDLAAGLKIAGKSCDCLENKHSLMLEASSEELISQDPSNSSAYQDIIRWLQDNQHKVTVAAIQSGKYSAEYPYMANEFKVFRKRVMGTVTTSEGAGTNITLDEAKKMAAEEAVKEVERAWKMES